MSEKRNGHRLIIIAMLVLALSLSSTTLTGAAASDTFPQVISLPDGFRPEGIAAGIGSTFYAGSIPTGAVYRGDLRTGEGEVLVPAQAGRFAIGLKFDERSSLLFVAGGPTGYAFIYNGLTGANVAEIQLTTLPSFINDVIVTQEAAYFTNSFQSEMYRVPLAEDGSLPNPPTSEAIPLGGDYQFTPGAFNANGIAATPNGKALFIVNSADGVLYRVNPETGEASQIDLGSGSVPNGDGILLQGRSLYVVQNSQNQVAVVELGPDFSEGRIAMTITSSLFRVPTTIARFGEKLYVVNARFDTTPTADTEYEAVRVPGN